jgi:hypothetical protein
MVFDYANGWFRISFEFFGFGRTLVLRKYSIAESDISRDIKQRIVRSISGHIKGANTMKTRP